jgi:hypothetical protein
MQYSLPCFEQPFRSNHSCCQPLSLVGDVPFDGSMAHLPTDEMRPRPTIHVVSEFHRFGVLKYGLKIQYGEKEAVLKVSWMVNMVFGMSASHDLRRNKGPSTDGRTGNIIYLQLRPGRSKERERMCEKATERDGTPKRSILRGFTNQPSLLTRLSVLYRGLGVRRPPPDTATKQTAVHYTRAALDPVPRYALETTTSSALCFSSSHTILTEYIDPATLEEGLAGEQHF